VCVCVRARARVLATVCPSACFIFGTTYRISVKFGDLY
jgi:hypothetical protein